MLVEVIMTALVVALAGMGIFLGLVGASNASGNNKHRSVASALAQEDQDRMRAFKTTDLSNYDETRTVTVAGVDYTIESAGRWVSDSSGALSCSNATQRANYLKITSAVTWRKMRIKPITLQSLVAPPPGSFNASQGNLVAQLQNQAGGPVAGVPVTLGPPADATETTEADGCAVFGAVTAGSYDLSFSRAGFVDPGGVNGVTDSVSVVASTTTTRTYQYAEAGRIAVSFDTQVGSGTPQPAQARAVSVSNPNLPSPGTRVFNPSGGAQSTIDATSLFPFTSGYGVYAGSCPEADPTAYNPDYYNTYPGLVPVAPGGSHAVTVRQPALNVAVVQSGAPLAGAHVVVTSTVAGCGSYPAQSTDAQGALPAPGHPFGTYGICADDGTRSVTAANIQNTDPAGTGTVRLDVPTAGAQGVCT
jgi:hypothetical protein